MKKIVYIIAILGGVLLSSCEEWLDVSPKAEIKSTKLFKTKDGFKDALTGIYIGLTDSKSYGQYLTWHILEDLARQYVVRSGIYEELQKYNYEEAVANRTISEIWLKQYNIIAEINKLLESLEVHGSVLDQVTFDIIKGEALALRAYCHFDLMRLYGYGNLANRPNLMSEKTIPYVTKHSKYVTEQKTYQETFKLLEKDITDALDLLVADPYYTGEIERPIGYEVLMEDPFFKGTYMKGRETRFNYGAIKAFQARVFLWEGKKKEALTASEEAIEIIKKYIDEEMNMWATESWGVGSSYYDDKVFYFEQLFCLDVVKLKDYISDFYKEYLRNFNYDRLIMKDAFVRDIYSINEGEGLSDLRYLHQLEKEGSNKWLTVKVQKTKEKQYTYFADVIPMVKISEPYLIAAECYASGETQNLAKSIEYINFLKGKRNIPDGFFLKETATQTEVETAIFKEYRKEFIQEGQLFYFYKRNGFETFPGLGTTTMTDKEYVVPYPDIESDLGLREQ